MDGSALDIGGSRARIYQFRQGLAQAQEQIWLPEQQPGESPETWGRRRVEAIADLVGQWPHPMANNRLPTACAGRKDDQCESVILSFYGSPLPGLVRRVAQRTQIKLGPLLDDDVCAGHGHLASPHGGLAQDSPDTILLTAGTGLAESLWTNHSFLDKTSYLRLSERALEDPLRAAAWRDGPLPLEALQNVLHARAPLGHFRRLVLSGRFAAPDLTWPSRIGDTELIIAPLEEAPALGALALMAGNP